MPETPVGPTRRVARLAVEPGLFLDLCKETEYPRVTRVTRNAIPAGAKIVGADFNNVMGYWNIGIAHDSFEPVPMGIEPPLLPPVEVTSSLGEWMRTIDRLADAEAIIAARDSVVQRLREALVRLQQWDMLSGSGQQVHDAPRIRAIIDAALADAETPRSTRLEPEGA